MPARRNTMIGGCIPTTVEALRNSAERKGVEVMTDPSQAQRNPSHQAPCGVCPRTHTSLTIHVREPVAAEFHHVCASRESLVPPRKM